MRMRLGVPLLAALVGLLGAVQSARAGHCGATDYSNCNESCGKAQCCFSSCQKQCRTCYKLVYDCCLEKRWHTCYNTVQETVMKPVCKTVYHAETKTCYKSVSETCYKTVECVQSKPVYQTCYKECQYTVCKRIPETCYKEVCYTVCKPVQTTKTVQKQVKENVCETYCKPGRCHTKLEWVAGECCFDPCTCKTHHKCGHFCRNTCKEPDQTCTRNVCKTRTVCEQVPCTTYVREAVHEKVPVTVCKKVPYTEVTKVPYTTKRSVCGAYVNAAGETSATEAPG